MKLRGASLYVTFGLLGGTGVVGLAACPAQPATFSIDPADLPKGGLSVAPSFVTCGSTDIMGCDVDPGAGQCCFGTGAPDGGLCADAGVACPAGTGVVTCNETADCRYDQVCCGTLSFSDGGSALTAACSTTCDAPGMQMCRTNGECRSGGKCVVQTCNGAWVLEFCGTYAAGGAACTPD